MSTWQYQRWDVFTDTVLAGNPLAVVIDAGNLTATSMQRIAGEFMLPETTFLCPTTVPAADFRVRIFTPQRELPMAGHPTVGTTFALARLGRIPPGTPRVTLQLGVGPTAVELEWSGNQLALAWMAQRDPDFSASCDEAAALARVLRLVDTDIATDTAPAQVVSSGVPFLFVPLCSRAAVDRAQLDRQALVDLCARLGTEELPVYLFSTEAGADDVTTYSRMFAPVFGIAEDPATGGASGPLAAYLARYFPHRAPEDGRLQSLQGVAMGRASRIAISLSRAESGTLHLKVGGASTWLGEGTFSLPPTRQPA
ncbi:MAG: PhzF family phenazine biosynthesis protein [Pseudomonadales bacterium]|nr:PhzF family phenazine biosynthesis protein [Pseudomonadales bacterium]MCP5184043.1 PhzF family phenazine biosynthesis protein [Pseudomonadales bacterium]